MQRQREEEENGNGGRIALWVCLCCICVLAIVGIILGGVALHRISDDDDDDDITTAAVAARGAPGVANFGVHGTNQAQANFDNSKVQGVLRDGLLLKKPKRADVEADEKMPELLEAAANA